MTTKPYHRPCRQRIKRQRHAAALCWWIRDCHARGLDAKEALQSAENMGRTALVRKYTAAQRDLDPVALDAGHAIGLEIPR